MTAAEERAAQTRAHRAASEAEWRKGQRLRGLARAAQEVAHEKEIRELEATRYIREQEAAHAEALAEKARRRQAHIRFALGTCLDQRISSALVAVED